MADPRARAAVARVVVQRVVPARPEVVFRCFTEPEELTLWFGPGDVRCTDARIDLRVGGGYRFEFRAPDGERSVVAGVYREIDPPRRLRFSWIVPGDAVTLEGTTRWPEYVADSGSRVEHHFCADCGAQLFGRSSGMPGVLARAGSLDDASWFQPQLHVFTASARPWSAIPATLPSFPNMPPAAR